jgi:hypothetical protein
MIVGPVILPVLETRLLGPNHDAMRWYLVQLPSGKTAWVNRVEVREVWPANHMNFVAGLYRYALGRYSSAYDEFDVFTRRADPQEDNVAVSLAYQFMAACLLKDPAAANSADRIPRARVLLDKAVALTPYDSRVLYSRAYTRFGFPQSDVLTAQDMGSIKADIAGANALVSKFQMGSRQQEDLEWFSFAASTPRDNADIFRATMDVPTCDEPLATLTVKHPESNSNLSLTQTLPTHFIKTLATHSNCFTVIDADAVKSFPRSEPHYVLTSTLNVSTLPALVDLGPTIGKTRIEAAQVKLSLQEPHSNQDIVSGEGQSDHKQPHWPPPTYYTVDQSPKPTILENRMVVTSAYLDAYVKLVQALKNARTPAP